MMGASGMTDYFELDDVTIQRVVEMEELFLPVREFFPAVTDAILAETREWMEPVALDPASGRLRFSFHSYVLRTPHHTILVDSCLGNDKDLPRWPSWHRKSDTHYMRNLAAIGLSPEDIDMVICTHLHADHIGWNTRLQDGRWVPTFPNARYLFSQEELAFWIERMRHTPNPALVDSVLPVIAANRAVLVTTDHVLDEYIRFLPTPGHTPNHFAVLLGRGEPGAILTGDALHSPLQVQYPELSYAMDNDPVLAGRTRRDLLERACDTNALCCTAHFPSPSVTRIRRSGTGFRCM
jgi:glyoxylase-like metal-dependent hydrolase (beta-lactamase superfamily II)